MASFSAKRRGKGVGVMGYLRMVVAATMGCFFGCFRMKESRYHPVTNPKKHMASQNKNVLSSLFSSDESDKDSDLEKGEDGNPLPDDVREYKDEARFLKACGTLLETPIEIRKLLGKCADISNQKEEKSKFNSWIPSTSIEQLNLERQSEESSTPFKVSGEGFLIGTPSRENSINSTQKSDTQNNETEWSGAFATTVKRTSKSVHFECQSSSENSSQYSKNNESSSKSIESKASPHPTPLKLNDEMQTPGTVYPACVNYIGGGKTTQIRSQYVYSVLNPTEHIISQWKELKEEMKDESSEDAALISTPLSGTLADDIAVGKEVASLSYWLKSDSADRDDNQGLSCGKKLNCGRTPGDRPIVGMVAAHWRNDEGGSHISPKWWDGNGIPNSTTKYKEDQKVSWHATPFEERLEKALSEDNVISQRRRVSGSSPFDLSDIEEVDTASSHSHHNSIVSF